VRARCVGAFYRRFANKENFCLALRSWQTSPGVSVLVRGLPQPYSITHQARSAFCVTASPVIIDAIAVADIMICLAAVAPDRVLYKTRERLREGRIELPSIDPGRDSFNDIGAPTGSVASGAVWVLGIEPT
jgi:hypothetical protein